MKDFCLPAFQVQGYVPKNPWEIFGLLAAPGGQKVLDLSDQGVSDTGDNATNHPGSVVVINYPVGLPII
jgi:hypothetical protein